MPVIIGEELLETKPIFDQIASIKGAIRVPLTTPMHKIESDLLPTYQQKNLNLAAQALFNLAKLGWKLDTSKNLEGFKNVVRSTGFQGRFQKTKDAPMTIVDAAHNPDGIKTLLAEVMLLDFDNLHLVYGTSKDKDLKNIMCLFPKDARYYFTSFDSDRAQSTTQLEMEAHRQKLVNRETFSSARNALKKGDAKCVAF